MKNRRIGILFDGVLIILKHKKNLGRCKTVFESFNNKCQRTFLPTRGKNFNLGKEGNRTTQYATKCIFIFVYIMCALIYTYHVGSESVEYNLVQLESSGTQILPP